MPDPDSTRAPANAWPSRISPDVIQTLVSLVTTAEPGRPTFTTTAPFTGEPIAALPRCTPADVDEAARRGRAAQTAWARRPVAERVDVIRRLHDLVFAEQDELLDLVQLEAGKARRDALEEAADVALVAAYYTARAPHLLRSRRRRGAVPGLTHVAEHRHPQGLVGLITPWNYPLTLVLTDAVPALLAGNAVIVKPARQTSLTALRAARMLRDAGLPPDVLQVVTGAGDELGRVLIDRVDAVAFTGSTEIGRRVAQRAGERLIPCTLELGGKNAAVVLDDADIEAAVEGVVRGAFANAGQLCISFERLFVARAIYDRFLDNLVAGIDRLRPGPGFDFETDLGCLISAEHLARVARHVDDARTRGATILTGGHPLPRLGPLFYAPTLVTDVPPEASMAREETFGPVLGLYAFDTDDEVVDAVNDSDYGLHASIWTRSRRRGRALARRIHTGTVAINDAYAASWGSTDAPMGGTKASGLGRRHGADGLLRFTRIQSVADQGLYRIASPGGFSSMRLVRHASRLLRFFSPR